MLEMNHATNSERNGRLPATAPLANAFVPFQNENSPRYEARKGLIRGTLYPGLDLPFMGMVIINPAMYAVAAFCWNPILSQKIKEKVNHPTHQQLQMGKLGII